MMNYLKRRFSSGDLQGELKDQQEFDAKMNQNSSSSIINNTITQAAQKINMQFSLSNQQPAQEPRKGPSPSAPSSPTKSMPFGSVINAARGIINTTINQTTAVQQPSQQQQLRNALNKDKSKILLVIDNDSTDWSKYFRGKRLFGDYEIRIEQAEFKDLNLASYSDKGCIVDIDIQRNGTKLVRSFKPDFVLLRQHIRDTNSDWRNLIIGLEYAGIPSINTLQSLYNFADRPWVFSGLVKIQKKLGDAFPLINQAYYPNYKEMLTANKFPCVVKVGHAHQGMGKIKVQNNTEFQDITSLVALNKSYSTTEPFIDAKYDIHLQKIGNNLKAFTRKSITSNWKANIGTSMLEQIPINNKYKLWIDEVSKLFGGLDIFSIEVVVGQDSKEYIIDINDSSMTLLGESQEEDKKLIADLVYEKMMLSCRPKSVETTKIQQMTRPQEDLIKSMPSTTSSHSSISSINSVSKESINSRQLPAQPLRQQSSISTEKTDVSKLISDERSAIVNSISNQQSINQNQTNIQQNQPRPPARPQMLPQQSHLKTQMRPNGPNNTAINQKQQNNDDNEDTMKNLRKTFAGIFGDM